MEATAKKRVLVIDDDTGLLSALHRLLTLGGYDTATVSSAEDGLRIVDQYRPDAIILDIAMPGMSGLGFLKEISGSDGKARFPVIVLTARTNLDGFFADLDVADFIQKPCRPEVLLNAIEKVVGRTGTVTPTSVRSAAGAPKSGGVILLAEDESGVGGALVDGFKAAGYSVQWVGDGAELMERAIVAKPVAVVTKRVLVGMNGDRVAGLLYELPMTRNIPVVLYGEDITADERLRVMGRHPNVRAYVSGNSIQTLLPTVRSVVAG